jgi:hypothetical protein
MYDLNCGRQLLKVDASTCTLTVNGVISRENEPHYSWWQNTIIELDQCILEWSCSYAKQVLRFNPTTQHFQSLVDGAQDMFHRNDFSPSFAE